VELLIVDNWNFVIGAAPSGENPDMGKKAIDHSDCLETQS